jgi:hypothetical protein
MIGRSHGHTDLEAGLEAHHAAKLQRTSSSLARETLGEKVVAVVLIAPTLLNWLVLAEAQLVSTAQLVDSDGVTHIVQRSRTVNFEQFFFAASATCVSTVSAHVWLTMGAIARRHTLGQTGAVSGESYATRLKRAEVEAGTLNATEWAHVAVVAFDFFFAAFVVFSAAMGGDFGKEAAMGILPGAGVALIARCVLGPARAAVIRTQRTNSVAFAGNALRGSMMVLMVQVLVLARCVHILRT